MGHLADLFNHFSMHFHCLNEKRGLLEEEVDKGKLNNKLGCFYKHVKKVQPLPKVVTKQI